MSSKSNVEVWIYDLSKGLARSMSMPLLGKQLDGIWHTAIVVFGKEYFFGGDSIEGCTPGGTILGQPNTKINLGTTEVPYEIFHEHLRELSQTTFRPCDYHLLTRNCNNFSSEVAQFLTGNDIPSYITNLPDEVLNTPFGQMLRPMLDSMTVNPGEGAHRVFGESEPSHRVVQPAASGAASAASTATASAQSAMSPTTALTSPTAANSQPHPDCVVFSSQQKLSAEAICEAHSTELSLISELIEYISTDDVTWSISPAHVKTLGLKLSNSQSSENTDLIWRIFQQLMVKPVSLPILKRCDNSVLVDQLNAANIESLKCLCNMCSVFDGYMLCLSKKRRFLESIPGQLDSFAANPEHLNVLVSIIYNISVHHKLVDDLDIQYTCAMVEHLNNHTTTDVETVVLMLKSLLNFMSANGEVKMLAFSMGLDTSKYTQSSSELKGIAEALSKLNLT